MARTQWRVAPMGGVVGLDYQVMFKLMERVPEDFDLLFEKMQIIEGFGLAEMRKP